MSVSGREVAHRLFAAEYDDATYSYSESDEERAPNYVVTPTGARVNRVFFVGVLTEVEQVSDDVLRARVADPTGAFVIYAGQYQPDEMAFLEEADPPMFVAVTGKARTFSPDDSDRVFTSVRPESINEVDADTRDRWTVEAAEATLARVATFAAALDTGLTGDSLGETLQESGVPEELATGIPVAMEQYGTTGHYAAVMADQARDALALVAGTADEIKTPSVTPGDAGEETVDVSGIGAAVGGAVVDLAAGESSQTGDTIPDEPPTSDLSEESTTDAGTAATANGDEESAAAVDQPADTDTEPGTDASAGSGEEAADDLGDFEPANGVTDEATIDDTPDEGAADTAADDDPIDDVVDEEERQRIEEEYGTDFSTGSEVSAPGEADIEPEAGPIEPEETEPGVAETDETEFDGTEPDETDVSDATDAATAEEEPAVDEMAVEDQATAEDGTSETAETAEEDQAAEPEGGDLDLEEAVLDAMAELDEGDGADREAVVAAVVDEHGVDPGAVEDAIQDALMAGKCYEPDDETVKPI